MPDAIEPESLEELASQIGGQEALATIISMYSGKLPGEIKDLEAAVAGRDFDAIQSGAHRLKSSSGQLGARRLAVMLAGLEESGRSHDSSAAERILVEVTAEARQVVIELEAFRP